jgi:hypothetical protein
MTSSSISRILAKDLRRFWPLALCAFGLTVLSTELALHPASGFPGSERLVVAPMVISWFLVAFVAVAAMQDDPAGGDRGGWLARPISGLQVLAAKLIFLATTLVVPSAVAAAWAACALHGSPGSVATAALSMGELTFVVSLCAAVLGSLTGTLLNAVFAAVALGVADSFLKIHLNALGDLLAPISPVFGQFPQRISDETQYLILILGGTAGAVAVLWHQYEKRRTRRSAILCACMAAVLWLSAQGWPWLAISGSRHRENPRAEPPPVALSVTDSRASIEQILSRSYPLEDEVVLGLQMRRGEEKGAKNIFPSQSQSRFSAQDGRSITMPRPEGLSAWSSPTIQSDEESAPDNLLEALGSPPIPRPPLDYTVGILTLPRSAYGALRGARGKLESWIQFEFSQLHIAGRIPLAPGSRLALPGLFWRIRYVLPLPNGGVNVAIDDAALRSRLSFYNSYFQIALVNKARNEAADNPYGGYDNRSAMVVQSGSRVSSFRRTWNLATRQKSAGLDEDWLEHAELVILTWDYRPLAKAHFDWGGIELPASPARN